MYDDYRRRLTDGWPRSVPDRVVDGLASYEPPRSLHNRRKCRLLRDVLR